MLMKTLALLLLTAVQDSAQPTDFKLPAGPEFKIQNEVIIGNSALPAARNLTLFQPHLVIDVRYVGTSHQISEIAIFDAKDRSFVLLDVSRKLRLKVDNLQLMRILDGMRKELQSSPKVEHLLFADAIEKFDAENKLIRVASDRIEYEVVGFRPPSDPILAHYLSFLDNYTLLGVTDPTRMPPFARIRLNRAIKKFGLMPKTVSLTLIDADGISTVLQATSKHELETSLSESDHQLVATTRRYWMEFRQVSLSEYRSIELAEGPDRSARHSK